MIEDAHRIFNYLPIEYKTKIESDYVAFLWEAFTANYEKENYQFAYIAYHMLFMCFVYFQLTKIYLNTPDSIKKILIFTKNAQDAVDHYENKSKEALAKKSIIPHFDPFSLARESESTIVGLFISIGCEREAIKRFKKLVDERNNVAHANGNINFSAQSSLNEKIEEVLNCIDHIHQKNQTIIQDCTKKFLLSSSDPVENEYMDTEDQVREIFIRKNYLSPFDLYQASKYPVEEFIDEEGYTYINELALSISILYSLPKYEAVVSLARSAVEHGMESAVWDEQNHKIILMEVPGENGPVTFTSYEDLEKCLIECANTVFWANSPHYPEEEFPLEFEAKDQVYNVLVDYDDKLDQIFVDEGLDE
jgi:hypothetical protein